MRNTILSISLLLGCLIVYTPKLLSAQTSPGSYFKVHFKKKGSILIYFYGQNYRHTSIFIKNKKNIDTTIVEHFNIDKPTVFSTTTRVNNKTMVYSFIGFNQKDTISTEAMDSTIFESNMSMTYTIPSYVGNDKKMILFNELYGVSPLYFSPYTLAEYDIKKVAVENEKSNKLKQLSSFIKEYKMDSLTIQLFKNYIDLRYYYQLLSENYKKPVPQGWKHPDIARFDSVDIRNHLLQSINTPEIRGILGQLILYNAYLNNRQDKTLYENCSLLNPRLYKTKMLDGLILDILEGKIKSISGRKEVLDSLKNYMLDNEDGMISLSRDGMISKEVLTVKLIGYDGKITQFDELLKGDQKIIVLDFWASWCAPCVAEIPKLKESIARLGNKIKFISISSDVNSEKWMDGCNKHNVKENSYLLSDISNNGILKSFGITQYPTFVVITNEGEVLSWSFFRPSEAKFDITLQKMLEVF